MKHGYRLVPLALVALLAGCGQQATLEQAALEMTQKAEEKGAEPANRKADDTLDTAEESTSSVASRHTAMTSLDWHGAYQGVTPCADCEGIDTTLTLNQDKTYQLTRTYLGKSAEAFQQEGTFSWDKTGRVVILEGLTHGPDQFFVAENRVIMQDMEGDMIEGELADRYVLKKQ